MPSRFVYGALVVALSGLLETRAAAEDKRMPSEPRNDEEVTARLHFIESRFKSGDVAANAWSYGWTGTYAAAALGQAAAVFAIKDKGLRQDFAVGAFSASLGVLPFAIFPFTPQYAVGRLAGLPESTPAQRRAKLIRAEHLLKKSAHNEAFGRSWLSHLGGFGVNIAFGVVLALGYHRFNSAVESMVPGIAISELQILTQPTQAIDDWDAYLRGDLRIAAPHPPKAQIMIAPSPGGIGIGGRF